MITPVTQKRKTVFNNTIWKKILVILRSPQKYCTTPMLVSLQEDTRKQGVFVSKRITLTKTVDLP